LRYFFRHSLPMPATRQSGEPALSLSMGRGQPVPKPCNPGRSCLVAVIRLRRPERGAGLSRLALNSQRKSQRIDRNSHSTDPFSLFSHFGVFFFATVFRCRQRSSPGEPALSLSMGTEQTVARHGSAG
jgi:hypothetical protein